MVYQLSLGNVGNFWCGMQRVQILTGEANSFAYLTQRLSVAVQLGNAASVLRTMKMGSQEEEFFVLICILCE